MENQKLFVLDRNDGLQVMEIRFSSVANSEQALRAALAASTSTVVLNIATAPRAVGALSTAISSNGSKGLVWGCLDSLQLRAPVEPVDGGFVCPNWTGPETHAVPIKWTPPANMKIVLAAVFISQGGARNFSHGYLVATKVGTPGWYRLPMPNAYENGKLCLGDGLNIRQAPKSLAEMWTWLLTAGVEGGRFNTDLITQGGENWQAHTRGMFRWDGEGKQVGPPTNWETLAHKTNSSELDPVVV